jgi:hypothetical protein
MDMKNGRISCGLVRRFQMDMKNGRISCGLVRRFQMDMKNGRISCGLVRRFQMDMKNGRISCGLVRRFQMDMKNGRFFGLAPRFPRTNFRVELHVGSIERASPMWVLLGSIRRFMELYPDRGDKGCRHPR